MVGGVSHPCQLKKTNKQEKKKNWIEFFSDKRCLISDQNGMAWWPGWLNESEVKNKIILIDADWLVRLLLLLLLLSFLQVLVCLIFSQCSQWMSDCWYRHHISFFFIASLHYIFSTICNIVVQAWLWFFTPYMEVKKLQMRRKFVDHIDCNKIRVLWLK